MVKMEEEVRSLPDEELDHARVPEVVALAQRVAHLGNVVGAREGFHPVHADAARRGRGRPGRTGRQKT